MSLPLVQKRHVDKVMDAVIAALCLFSAVVVVVLGGALLHKEGIVYLSVMASAFEEQTPPATSDLLLNVGIYSLLLAYSSREIWKEVKEYNEQ